MNATDEKLAEVEKLRRNKNYPAMQRLSDELLAGLGDSIVPEAERVRSRVYYEMSMVSLQRAWDMSTGAPSALYEESGTLANRSARHAHNARDPIGVMFAEVNIGGHILPGLGKKDEGLKMLRRVLEQAQELLPGSDEKNAKKLERTVSNARILIEKNTQ